jgi:hypothetical protein
LDHIVIKYLIRALVLMEGEWVLIYMRLELDLAYPHFGGAALIAGGSALLEQAAES